MTTPQLAYPRQHRLRVVLVAGVFPLALAFVGAGLVYSWRDRLPESIAIQWGGDGPSNFAPVGGVIALIVGIALVLAIGFLLATLSLTDAASPSRGRLFSAGGVWITSTITFAIVGSAWLQLSPGETGDGAAVGRILLVGALISLVPGGLAWALVPRSTQADPSAERAPEPIELTADERAVFTRRAMPGRGLLSAVGSLLAVLLVLTVVLAVFDSAGLLAVVIVVVVSALVFTGLIWRVTINGRGLTARSSLGLPRFRLPIAEIASARVSQVDPLAQFGGWGVRFGNGGVGVVVAAGEGLEITRTDGRRFTVTVADASVAAGLVNGFVARARRQ